MAQLIAPIANLVSATRARRFDPVEAMRLAIVCGSALALILAGRALPF